MALIRGGHRPRTTTWYSAVRPLAEALERRSLLTVTFATPTLYTGVGNVTGIAVGDLNGDGKPDVVVAGLAPSSSNAVVGIYLNKGNGTLGTPTLIPITGTPAGIALGNFTGSGKLDIAAVDSSTNSLDVFANDGAGNFSPGVGASLGGTPGDTAIAVGDFNGDGKDDVAVVNPTDGNVVVEFSNGDMLRSFTLSQHIQVPMPKNVIVADFNGDGHPDLAILSGNGSIYVALNAGNGTFGTPVPYSLGQNLTSATGEAYAPLTASKLNDLIGVGAGPLGGTFGEFINQGAGVFAPAIDASTTFAPVAVVAGNFSGAGHSDLAFLSATGALTIQPGKGDGTYDAAVSVFSNQLGSVGTQAVSADFNGDGSPDLAFVSNAGAGGFGVTLNTTGGSAGTATLTPTVARSTLPTQAVGGTAVSGSAIIDVTNSTAATVKGPVTVALFASSDGSIDTASVSLGSAKRTLTLKANGSAAVLVPDKLPTTLGSGSYTLLAQTVDPSGNVTSAAIGPSLTVAAPFLAFSETVTTTGLASSVVSGTKSTAMAKVVIVNSGNVAAKGSTTIDLSASIMPGVAGNAINSVTTHQPIAANGGKATVLVPFKALPNLADNSYYITASVTDPMGGSSIASTSGTTTIAAPFITLGLAFGAIPKTVLTAGAPLIITNSGNIDDTSTFTATIGFATDSAGANIVGANSGTLAPAKVTVRAGKTANIHMTGWDPIFKNLVVPGPYFLTVTLTDAFGNSATVVSTVEIG